MPLDEGSNFEKRCRSYSSFIIQVGCPTALTTTGPAAAYVVNLRLGTSELAEIGPTVAADNGATVIRIVSFLGGCGLLVVLYRRIW